MSLTELQALYVAVPSDPLPDLTSSPLGENYLPSGTVMEWKASAPIKIYSDVYKRDQPAEAAGMILPGGVLSIQKPLLLDAPPARPLLQTLVSQATETQYCGINTVKASSNPDVRMANPAYWYFLKDIEVKNTYSPALQPQWSPPYEPPKYGGIGPAELDSGTSAYLIWTPEDLNLQAETQCVRGLEQINNSRNIIQDNVLINVKLTRGWNALTIQNTKQFTAPNGVHVYSSIWAAIPAEKLTKWR